MEVVENVSIVTIQWIKLIFELAGFRSLRSDPR